MGHLIQVFKSEDIEARNRARHALVEIGEPAIEPLIEALEIRGNVANWARGTLVEMAAIDPLIQALENGSDDVRYLAVDGLGTIRGERVVEPLIQALKDENTKVRWVAAMHLGNIRDKRAIEPLIQALEDRSEDVRRNAKNSLERIEEILEKKSIRACDICNKGVESKGEGTFPPFDSDFYKFATALAEVFHSNALIRKGRKPYGNFLMTPDQVIAFYDHYSEKLSCFWTLGNCAISTNAFYLHFFEKGQFKDNLELIGLFEYNSISALREHLEWTGCDPDELALEGLFTRNFMGEDGNQMEDYYKEKVEKREFMFVAPEELKDVFIRRMSGELAIRN